MTAEDERSFKPSSRCWVCGKLSTEWDNKVRNHDHVIDKYRDSAHWDCNINLKLTKKISVIFKRFL